MKIRIVLILTLFISAHCIAQEGAAGKEENKGFKFKKENLVLDGNLGIQIGTYTFIDVSPVLAYKFTPKFMTGPGLIYRYYGNRFYNTSNYGWRYMARYYPIERLFAHSEFQQIFVKDLSNQSQVVSKRVAVNSLLAGLGYVQSAGPTSIYFMILYDFLYNPNSPYQNLRATNPVIRVGITAGF